MNFGLLSMAQKIVMGVLAGALAISLGWGARVNNLRAYYKAALSEITVTLDEVTSYKKEITIELAPLAVRELAGARDQYKRERNNARDIVRTQSGSIKVYEAETKRLKALSEKNAKQAAALIADRNVWIKKARQASTREARLLAESELRQCEEVLDALYEADM
jgi:uncharacterized transporter YbjL